MNEELFLSPEGAALIKQFEGCHKAAGGGQFKPYICPGGKLTVGFGHTNDHGRKFTARSVWTQDECDKAFEEDMEGFEAGVRRLVHVPLEQHQFDALVSFAYNCGLGALGKSGLLAKVNRRDFTGAAREFLRWNHAKGRVLPGLTRRRHAESLLFSKGNDPDDEGMPQAIDRPEASRNLAQTGTAQGAVGAALASLSLVLGQMWEEIRPIVTDPAVVALVGAIIVGLTGWVCWQRQQHLDEDGI